MMNTGIPYAALLFAAVSSALALPLLARFLPRPWQIAAVTSVMVAAILSVGVLFDPAAGLDRNGLIYILPLFGAFIWGLLAQRRQNPEANLHGVRVLEEVSAVVLISTAVILGQQQGFSLQLESTSYALPGDWTLWAEVTIWLTVWVAFSWVWERLLTRANLRAVMLLALLVVIGLGNVGSYSNWLIFGTLMIIWAYSWAPARLSHNRSLLLVVLVGMAGASGNNTLSVVPLLALASFGLPQMWAQARAQKLGGKLGSATVSVVVTIYTLLLVAWHFWGAQLGLPTSIPWLTIAAVVMLVVLIIAKSIALNRLRSQIIAAEARRLAVNKDPLQRYAY